MAGSPAPGGDGPAEVAMGPERAGAELAAGEDLVIGGGQRNADLLRFFDLEGVVADLGIVEHPRAVLGLARRITGGPEHLGDEGDPALVRLVDGAAHARRFARPVADRRIVSRVERLRLQPEEKELQDLGFEIGLRLVQLGEGDDARLLPFRQEPVQQRLPAAEMPVEAAAGDAQAARDAVDLHRLDALRDQESARGRDPLPGSDSLRLAAPVGHGRFLAQGKALFPYTTVSDTVLYLNAVEMTHEVPLPGGGDRRRRGGRQRALPPRQARLAGYRADRA